MAMTVRRAAIARTMACGVVLAALGSTSASAAPYYFQFGGGGYSDLNFYISEQIPGGNSSVGNYFQTTAYDATYGGSPVSVDGLFFINSSRTADYSTVQFKIPASSGYYLGTSFNYGTEQLYTGPEDNPTFKTSAFTFSDDQSSFGGVKISGGPSAPAPQIGGGLLAGLAALGALGLMQWRRGRRTGAFATA